MPRDWQRFFEQADPLLRQHHHAALARALGVWLKKHGLPDERSWWHLRPVLSKELPACKADLKEADDVLTDLARNLRLG